MKRDLKLNMSHLDAISRNLPKDYRIASFDYDFLCVRKEGYISVIVKDVDYDNLNIKSVISRLKDYIKSFSLIEEI